MASRHEEAGLIDCAVMPFDFGINNPSLNGLLSRAASESQQGAMLGMNQSLASLARVAGPLFGGGAFGLFGPSSPFLIAAAILVVAGAIASSYARRYRASFGAE